MLKPKDSKPVFLLGVGAQKGGTTWLWQYLKNHPQCAIGSIKEYAVFNSVFMPETFPIRRQMWLNRLIKLSEQRLQQLKNNQKTENPAEMLALMDNIGLALDLDRYVPHFQSLLRKSPAARLVADITPEYCALSQDHFRQIRNMLVDGGFDVRVVYLMRDPVERCYSMVRMGDRNNAREGQVATTPASERLAQAAVQPWCEIRTRYDQTITALEAVFQPNEIHYDFYERFISDEGVSRIDRFLGIDFLEPNVNKMANVSPRDSEPSDDAIASVRKFYDPVYQFCAEKFGQDIIKSVWKNA